MKTPAQALVESMTESEINRAVQEAVNGISGGRVSNYCKNWDKALGAAYKTGLLMKPRYLSIGPAGHWSVRQQHTKEALTRDVSGPKAVSMAIAVRHLGRTNEPLNRK